LNFNNNARINVVILLQSGLHQVPVAMDYFFLAELFFFIPVHPG